MPDAPEGHVDVPARWQLGYLLLAMASVALIMVGDWCASRRPEASWTPGWLLLLAGLSFVLALPAVVAALLAQQFVRRNYRGTWTELRPRLPAVLLFAAFSTGLVAAGASALLLRQPTHGTALLVGAIVIAAAILSGHLAAVSLLRESAEMGVGSYSACLALVALGITGLAGSLIPSIAAAATLCRYPEGFGGIIAGVGVLPAVVASGVTWVLVEVLSKWDGPVAR